MLGKLREISMTSQAPKSHIFETTAKPALGWQTILFNCDCHEFEAVVSQIIIAIGCDYLKASRLAYIAHQFESVSIYKGVREECERVANVLGSIGLLVKVVQ